MNILGINAYHGDASAALVVDGTLVAAVEEERFSRVKHDTSFPTNAIRYCLDEAGLSPRDVDHISLSKNPRANLRRRVSFAIGSPAGRRMAKDRIANLRKTLRARETFAEKLGIPGNQLRAKTHFTEHHTAHIASSFFVSPFERAAVLSIDGMGDMISARWGVGEGGDLRLMGEVGFPHSLGIYYTAVTQYLGFPKYGDEYKVMGLASYGTPAYLDEMRQILLQDRGLEYRLGLESFRHQETGTTMTWDGGAPEMDALWGPGMERLLGPARADASVPLEDRHYDIAHSMQKRLEEVELEMLRRLHAKTGAKQLCLAGGVALNCVANGLILQETPFEKIYIQPAANDAGTSVGAAYHVENAVLGRPRGFVMDHAYWGPAYSEDDGRAALKRAEVPFEELGDDEAIARTADRLASGAIVGWYQGRMEFGPRALGNRSILADPRRAEMKDILNARIKHREPFRPFAPSLLEEATGEYFDQDHPSPFMLMTYNVLPDKLDVIPAPTHVDGTGRLQTVRRDQNPRYYDLIKAFGERTGVPVLVNTSFNDNEPICCTPEEAVDCFLRTNMDVLVVGNLFAEKAPA
ncbi:MAG: carbamoyltransferase C-terminal domain-containing protein [Actinomycetota bacterium]